MTISIRQLETAVETQAQEISRLTLQLGYENNSLETYNYLQNLLKSTTDCIFVAMAEEKIVGWIHGGYRLTLEGPPFVEILGLVVDVDCRKQQIGKKLIEAVKTWSQALEVAKIRVRCNVKRLESHEFYKMVGFEETKRQVVFDWKVDSR